MTVAVQTPTISYAENGGTTEFAVPFRYNAPTDLRAVRRAEDGSEVVLVYGADFTATPGLTDAGGTLTVTEPAAAGVTLVIQRETSRAQPTDYITAGAFTADSHENALDRAILIAQEQDQTVMRAAKVPVGEVGPSLPSASLRVGKVAQFDTQGNFTGVSIPELAVLLAPEKQAGTTLAFTELTGPRSQAVVFDPAGVGEGGYWVEFSAQADTEFIRAYARVFAGTGTCDVRVVGGGDLVWSSAGVGGLAVDQAVTITLPAGADLIFIIENIEGPVTGIVIKLEGAAA